MGFLASVVLLTACSADGEEDISIIADDVPASAVDRPGPLDAATPAVDVVSPPDASTSRDLPTIFDIPFGLDRPPTIVDVPPTIVDTGPPDTGCALPPPVARPPAAGPDGSAIVRAIAAEHPDWLRDSCVPMGGNYRFLFEAVRRGRAVDPRWGLDRRTGSLSGDIVTYFYGDGCPEGRREVYMFDIITRHCAIAGMHEPAAPGWIDRSSEGGLWTLMGYDAGAPPDAGTPPDDGAPPGDVPHSRPPLPNGRPTVEAVASERSDWLRNSCVATGGNNDYLFEVVRRLRRIDRRWGLNWKRGRVGDMSQDVVNYYYGPGAPVEGSLETYVVDMISGHCGPTPGTTWIDQTGVGGAEARWTLAGRTDL